MNILNKVAIITGAGKGIGRAVSEALIREGCRVMLVSRTEEDLLELCRYAQQNGVEAQSLAMDLEMPGSADAVIQQTVKCFGRVDILINNAALSIKTNVLEMDDEAWDRSMNVNAKTQFFLAQKAMLDMIPRQSGHIIFIGSTILRGNEEGHAAYGTSKHAAAAAAQALYKEGRKHYIKITTLSPGVTDTPTHQKKSHLLPAPVVTLKPDDIAQTVVFLLKQSHRVYVPELFLMNSPYPEKECEPGMEEE